MPATKARVITLEQYEQSVRPTPQLTAADFFEHERNRAIKLGLMSGEEADPFRDKMGEGLVLLIPRKPEIASKTDLDKLVGLIELNGKTGVNYLDPTHLTNLVEEPEGVSLLVKLEDGHERRNIKPVDSRDKIKEEGRHPFTTWQGIWFAICFPHVLEHHYLDLVGSRYKSAHVPYLCLGEGEPALCSSGWGGNANSEWGAPSCGRVVF